MAIEYTPPKRPTLLNKVHEAGSLLDLAGFFLRKPFIQRGEQITDRQIMLLPGFATSEKAMIGIAKVLRAQGHRVQDWGLGKNNGRVEELLDAIKVKVAAHFEREGAPLDLVGWSLGGYIAREAARDLPDCVRSVVTLGSPIIGGPKYTSVAGVFESRGANLSDIEETVRERYATPIQTPITAIYSKNDGIVAWEACVDRWSPNVVNVEVASGHLGMIFSREAHDQVIRALAD